MDAASWTGWYRERPRDSWTPACVGSTIGECSRRLSEFILVNGIRVKNNQCYFITGGGYPDENYGRDAS